MPIEREGSVVRRPARGLDHAHPVVPAPAGLLESGGLLAPRGVWQAPRRSCSRSAGASGTTSPSRVTDHRQPVGVRSRSCARWSRSSREMCSSKARCRPAPPRSRSSTVSAGSPRRRSKYVVAERDPPRARRGRRPAVDRHHRRAADDRRNGDAHGQLGALRARAPSADQAHGGQPYYQPRIIADRDALMVEYLNNGFASADVDSSRPQFSADRTRVDVTFTVPGGAADDRRPHPDRRQRADRRRVILSEMKLQAGRSRSGARIWSRASGALGALGLFRRVRITELPARQRHARDVLVTVEEAPATTIGYGGGLEAVQRLRATGPERGGGGAARVRAARLLRHRPPQPRRQEPIGQSLSRASACGRSDVPDDPTKDGTGVGFSEYRVVGTYRQPRAIRSAATSSLTAASSRASARASISRARASTSTFSAA